jgi:CDP-diacylglycerol--glycerol-3-phosphate 3-phosphatidyltransferase
MAGLNLPTKITLARLFMVPPVVALLTLSSPAADLAAAIIFAVASFSDWLDGYLARAKKEVTSLGKILDPIADKLLVAGSLIPLVALDRASGWIVAVIIGREILVTGLRTVGAAQGFIIQAEELGKLKMVFQVAAILFLILNWNLYGLSFQLVGTVGLWAVMALSTVSGLQYFIKFWGKIDPHI